MNPFRIKVCGITNLEDALLARRLGATAIGLIFAPSSRQVSLDGARNILGNFPQDVDRVGVFANSELLEVLHYAETLGLTSVQLHGREDAQFLRELGARAPKLRRIKVVEVTDNDSIGETENFDCEWILFDSRRSAPAEPNSLRLPLDLVPLQSRLQKARPTKPFLIAGGLNPANVRKYVENLRPDGVDVSSGVEASVGRKCPEKMKMFMTAVREGFHGL